MSSATGDQQQAKIYFERAYAVDPLSPDVLNNLGVIASNEGNTDEAIRYFEGAVNLDSNSALYLTNLARAVHPERVCRSRP